VTVVTVERREIPVTSVLPGRTAPLRVAEVRPRVGGVLQERLFTEGQLVEAGQPLFQIAPAPFEAALRRAEAALTRHEAAERAALGTVMRLRALARAQAVSEQNLENAEANLRQIQADITSARAAIETACIDLGYTRVASPISGRTGRSVVTPGALVIANQPTSLVTVTQLDPIYVDLTQPAVPGQQLNATILGPSYLQTPEEFGAILLRVRADGAQVRLRDVATIEVGSENYAVTSFFNGRPAAGMGIRLASGANALETADAVRDTIERLRPSFPPGVDVVYPFDTTPFVKLSISAVVMTLIEAVVLVFLAMFLFLQNWRATLIPTLAIPVVLLGTFAVLSAAGFTINTLTMFGLVLAIGLLVDDAIVVVENVERVMAEEHLSPLEATRKSMDQITGALIGIGLVLSAVFLPMAFFGGSVGVIYRQFSVTIATAMALSVLVAIFFTPVLCATMLRPHKPGQGTRGFFGWFNRGFDRTTNGYVATVHGSLRRPLRMVLVYVALLGALGYSFLRLPGGFLPNEDQGNAFVQVILPPGATADRTQRALDEVTRYLLEEEGQVVASVFAINGFAFSGRGQNVGLGFLNMRDWKERPGAQNRVQAMIARLNARFATYQDALVIGFAPPAIRELGNATGFNFQILDRAGRGHAELMAARDEVLRLARQSPVLAGLRPNGLNDEAQFRLIVDWERASALGLSITDINSTLSAAWGSTYVNDFLDRGRIKRVFLQGADSARMQPGDLDKWFVRNAQGQMVPFSAFGRADWAFGSPRLERFNGVASREIIGTPAPGRTTGEAMAEMERLFQSLPPGFGFEWSGISFEERRSSGQAPALYAISLLVVFLCLAALYESWSVPTAVLLAVPLGILGAVLASIFYNQANDV